MTAAEMRKALAEVLGDQPSVFARQSHYYYPRGVPNPRNDRRFVDSVSNLLILNFRRRVHIEEVLGADPWSTHEAVEYLRQLGFGIVSEPGLPGYRFMVHRRPQPRPLLAPTGQAELPMAATA